MSERSKPKYTPPSRETSEVFKASDAPEGAHVIIYFATPRLGFERTVQARVLRVQATKQVGNPRVIVQLSDEDQRVGARRDGTMFIGGGTTAEFLRNQKVI